MMNVAVLCQDTCGPLFQQPLEIEGVGKVALSEQLRQPCPLALENSRCLFMAPLGQGISGFLIRACISGIAYETVCERHLRRNHVGQRLGWHSAYSSGEDSFSLFGSKSQALRVWPSKSS